jgi:lysophospholipase L1-like esterase
LAGQGCGFQYDGENEGHVRFQLLLCATIGSQLQGGFLAVNIANQNQLPGWLSSTKPDIVMMHLGTNDVWSNRSPQEITTAFSKLVDQMRASKPTMKILAAKIIPMNPSNCAECGPRVVALNNVIQTWAASKTTTNSPITVVDAWTGFNTNTMTGDGVHPNDTGNKQLADTWFQPLADAIRA